MLLLFHYFYYLNIITIFYNMYIVYYNGQYYNSININNLHTIIVHRKGLRHVCFSQIFEVTLVLF